MEPSLEASESRPGKRRRIALACSSCRMRKSKCDGRRPGCTTCASLGIGCEYDSIGPVSTVAVQHDHLVSLEERLRHAESLLQRHDDLLHGHLSRCANGEQAARPRRKSRSVSTCTSQIDDAIELDVSAVQDGASEDARTDGMAMTFVKEQASAFFGESSNIAFARQLLVAIARTGKTKHSEDLVPLAESYVIESRTSGFGQEHYPSATESPGGTVYSGVMLPPAIEMERLLAIYFGSTAIIFPFIHEPSFRQTYDEFKAHGFTRVRRTWLGLLNIIFAMASNVRLDDKISGRERVQTSHVYYVRAVSLCGASSRQTVSLEIVQYLLLIVLYLQGSQQSTQTWGVHGLLVRTATALGLHAHQASKNLDPLQQDIRRRTWHTIYCLDKVLSMTFGRPGSIPEDQMTVRSPASAISLLPPGEVRSGNAPELSAEFLDLSVDLYKIMGRSLVKQYDSNLGIRDVDYDVLTTIQHVGELRQELRQWTSSLSSHLSLCESGSTLLQETNKVNNLRVILTLRYHNLKILIHRPLIGAMLHALPMNLALPRDDALCNLQLVVAHAQDCFSSAEATIDIVHAILATNDRHDNNLGVWFFTLYYVFTASLVVHSRVLWAQHGSNIRDDTTVTRGRSYLTKTVEALNRLDLGIPLVRNCVRYIQFLSSLLDSNVMQRSIHESGRLDSTSDGEGMRSSEQTIDGQAGPPSDVAIISDLFGNDGDVGQFFGSDMLNSAFFDSILPPQ